MIIIIILFKIEFGLSQISVPKIGKTMPKTAVSTSDHHQSYPIPAMSGTKTNQFVSSIILLPKKFSIPQFVSPFPSCYPLPPPK